MIWLHRKEAVRHLGYAWWHGCGWAWRGRYICRICYAPRERVLKTEDTIRAMRDRLDDNIFEHGWDAEVQGAYTALAWVLSDDYPLPVYRDALLRFMERPEEERKRIWVAYGGNPEEWETET